MTVFLIAAALLVAATLAIVLPPLLRNKQMEHGQARRDELNLAVLRDQLRELDADLAAGMISPTAYDSARHELELRVAEEVQPSADDDSERRRPLVRDRGRQRGAGAGDSGLSADRLARRS